MGREGLMDDTGYQFLECDGDCSVCENDSCSTRNDEIDDFYKFAYDRGYAQAKKETFDIAEEFITGMLEDIKTDGHEDLICLIADSWADWRRQKEC